MNIDDINELFRTYHNSHRNMVTKKFRENGLYFGQPPILKYLSEHDNATQQEIADFLGVSKASIAVSVKRMEETGLIMRVIDKTDARRNNLQLTEKGKEVKAYADDYFKKADTATFEGFNEQELLVLGRFLKRMNENIENFAKEDKDA